MPYLKIEDKRRYEREYISRPDVKERRKVKQAEWAEKNKDHLVAQGAKRRLEKRAMTLIATSRTRARKKGLEFDLGNHVADIQRRIDLNRCEVTGQPFDLSPGRRFNSPSLDRIDPSKGYTHANTRVVLNIVNVALGDWGEGVLRKVMTEWLA